MPTEKPAGPQGRPVAGAMFGKLEVAPTYRVVFDTVEHLIMTGRLRPNDVLPTETELAERFSINRSTVREGIRLLEQNGLVVRGAAKRLTVAVPRLFDIASRTSRALLLHDVTFHELWQTYMILEPSLAELAARNADEATIAKLERNIEALEAATDDIDRFYEIDSEFHQIIAEAANNKPLLMAREPISILMLPAAFTLLPRLNTYDRVIEAHRQILDAIRSHDPARSAEWMRKHCADFKRGYEVIGAKAAERLVSYNMQQAARVSRALTRGAP